MRNVFQGSRSAREDITHGFSTFEYFGPMGNPDGGKRPEFRRSAELPNAGCKVTRTNTHSRLDGPDQPRKGLAARRPIYLDIARISSGHRTG